MKLLMDINTIRVDKLNNDEFAQFIKSTIGLLEDTTLEKLNVKQEAVDKLRVCLDSLTEASRQSRHNEETHKIMELDKKRSKLVVFLLTSFRNERNNVLETKKEAGTILYNLTKNFLGIQSIPIRQKTQSINALIKDLKSNNAVSHVKTLELTKVIEALEGYNNDCQKLIEGRAENQFTSVKINTKKVRKEASDLYRYITKYAFATYLLQESDESKNFIGLLNKLVDDTMNANKQRLAQSAMAKSIKKETE